MRTDHTTRSRKDDLTLAPAPVSNERWPFLWALLLGIGLGLGAVVADIVPNDIRQVLYPLFSTGLVWGLGAILAGSKAPSRVKAALAAVLVLLVATWVYYGSILLLGLRPDAGSASVLRAAAIWTAVSFLGGVLCGVASWWAVNGRTVGRSVALGLIGGALGAQGLFEAVRSSSYILEPNARATLVAVAVFLLAPLALLVWRRRTVLLRIAVPVTVMALMLGASAWAVIIGALGTL
ncbi:DUF6518 family protein [Microbacterium sp. CH-015]|uniref:DUF6518 family protein n=1 Tax=Microbacterium sp. CH-015 TaxID=3406734 RepID=UPI003C72C337